MKKRIDDVSAREPFKPAEDEIQGVDDRSPGENGCRCKEAKGKTVTELLRVMLSDLAFWKKPHH